MKQNLPFVSNMKLRLGWGIVGNDRIANFLSLDSIHKVNMVLVTQLPLY